MGTTRLANHLDFTTFLFPFEGFLFTRNIQRGTLFSRGSVLHPLNSQPQPTPLKFCPLTPLRLSFQNLPNSQVQGASPLPTLGEPSVLVSRD